ncbi:MAG: hypothetical protein HOW73_18270 [Polyangiaceae bacterium]|nr:hypothetical protein [Polyangiaceae bacterium]
MAHFVAVDVQTANAQSASICQVATATFDGATVTDSWSSLVDPGPTQEFSPLNVRLNGITAEAVQGKPSLVEVLPRLRTTLQGTVAAVFSPFTRGSIERACAAIAAPAVGARWIDVLRVVRRISPPVSVGFALPDVAGGLRVTVPLIGDGEARAEAIGRVFIASCAWAGIAVDALLSDVDEAFATEHAGRDQTLAGETIAFTGSLVMVRADAERIAAAAGCEIGVGVTKQTTILVVGDQDARIVGPSGKSSKHKKAEKLIDAGQPIRIIGESDFFALIQSN